MKKSFKTKTSAIAYMMANGFTESEADGLIEKNGRNFLVDEELEPTYPLSYWERTDSTCTDEQRTISYFAHFLRNKEDDTIPEKDLDAVYTGIDNILVEYEDSGEPVPLSIVEALLTKYNVYFLRGTADFLNRTCAWVDDIVVPYSSVISAKDLLQKDQQEKQQVNQQENQQEAPLREETVPQENNTVYSSKETVVLVLGNNSLAAKATEENQLSEVLENTRKLDLQLEKEKLIADLQEQVNAMLRPCPCCDATDNDIHPVSNSTVFWVCSKCWSIKDNYGQVVHFTASQPVAVKQRKSSAKTSSKETVIKPPAPDTVCGMIWASCDHWFENNQETAPKVSDLYKYTQLKDINNHTIQTQLYRWRKWKGFSA